MKDYDTVYACGYKAGRDRGILYGTLGTTLSMLVWGVLALLFGLI